MTPTCVMLRYINTVKVPIMHIVIMHNIYKSLYFFSFVRISEKVVQMLVNREFFLHIEILQSCCGSTSLSWFY